MRRGRGPDRTDSIDLDVLDPITGELVVPRADRAAALDDDEGLVPGTRGRVRRVRALRRGAIALAVLSLVSALGAAYFGVAIGSVRHIERTWRTAMALDAERVRADAEVRAAVAAFDDPEDDAAGRAAIGRIGEEVAGRLLAYETALRDQWVADDRTDRVRDAMVEALRFRRFQLTPDRRLLGDSPIQRVEALLGAQLDRYDLAPSRVATPVLRSEAPALAEVHRFADLTTGTTLVAAVQGRRLLTIEVDASRVHERRLDAEVDTLVAAGDLAVVASAGTVTAYPVDVDAPARWAVPGRDPVAARSVPGTSVWMITPQGIVGVSADGAVSAPLPVPLPHDGALLADTRAGLLVREGEQLQLWDPATGAPARTLTTEGRFAGASASLVAVQTPGRPSLDIHDLRTGERVNLALPRTDAGEIVQAPGRNVAAFAAGPLAGNIASVLRLELEAGGWSLVGVGGPRVSIRPGAMAWAPARDVLFWVTPDGRVALAEGYDAHLVRAPVRGLQAIVAFPASL
jgi:hypothetical protein